jgi:hypothetical protein
MPFEYEALVGQLYVVGGRSISTAPPGALVEVAPLNAARGREADTFFALVLPSGDALAPSAFYERMAQTAAEQYFESTGSVTAGIRETIDYLNKNLVEFNQSHPEKTYEANLLCAVLRGDDLILGRVGSGVVVFYHQGKCETLPADLANDEALYGPPLGVQSLPEVKLSRHRVTAGTRMILADANLADFTGVQLSDAISADDISLAIVAFKELARLQLSLLAVEFVPPEGSVPTSVPVREGASTFEIAEAQRLEAAKAKSRQTDTVSTVRRNPLGKTGQQLVERSQLGLARGASVAAQGISLSNRTIEHYFGSPADGRRRFPIPLATGLVILLPILVVSVVVALWISSSGESAFEQCLNNVLTYADTARGAEQSSANNRIQLWTVTYTSAVDCQVLRQDDASLQAIMDEAQHNIDVINDIDRRDAIPLQPAISGAIFDRIILNGRDLYLLDKTNGIVYRASLSAEDGLSFSLRPSPIENMSRGASVDGYRVDGLVDIAFSEPDNAITLLTTNGVIIQCDSILIQTCDAQQLRNFEQWESPLRITFFGEQANFYVLDPAANQIWRYTQQSGAYINPGAPYFDGVNRDTANVTNAVDFSIDSNGLVYVLLSDGNIQRYQTGEIQPFDYADMPESQSLDSAVAMYINDAPVGSGIYVADQRTRTIFEFGLGGTRRATYRISEEEWFNSLTGVTASSTFEVIYAISGNSVLGVRQRAPE